MNEKNEKNFKESKSSASPKRKRRPLLEVEKRRREERSELKKDNKLVKGKKDIRIVGFLFGLVFVGMIAYFGQFLLIGRYEIEKNSYNTKVPEAQKTVIKGDILASDGTILAETVLDENGKETRRYPFGAVFAHVVGYSSRGVTGLESNALKFLTDGNITVLDQVYLELASKKVMGNSVKTTLDVELQKVAYEQLGDYKGSIVAIEPSTGKILAMVSKPDYDPNTLASVWDSIIADKTNSSLVNRATQGLYPPGSTFKVLTALEYIRENGATWESYVYDCAGTFTHNDITIQCVNQTAHGHLDIMGGLRLSCNGVFLQTGLTLDLAKYHAMCESFGFNEKLPIDMVSNQSSFKLNAGASDWDVMQTVFGQGQTLISPLHMTMIAASIANDGVMMSPYLLDSVIDAEGNVLEQYTPSPWKTVMNQAEAETLTIMMNNVVNHGTGYMTQSDQYQSACKTGSAEFDGSGATHAWYMGFAPVENPKIAVVVLLEEGGSGGLIAGPMAKAVYDAYLLR